ncbi:hypothetical protein [Cyclobacterium amurskyense]|uniref:hypothetical protein n=1 Tax=Cyclobacterium amurskyense TaxID=320787 RepID=UPI0030DA97C3
MKRRLLTKDYQRIVLESFIMPSDDWHKYYLNLIETNYQYNTDIIEQIETILNQWIEFYESKVYGELVPFKNENGKIEYVGINQIFGVDENGNKTPINMDNTFYPFQIKIEGVIHDKSMNRYFFDEQIKIIGTIKDAITLKNNLIEFEKKLPEPIRSYFKENPMPEGFELSDLEKRVEIIGQIPELLKEQKEKLQNIINENNKEEPRKYTIQQYSLAYIFDCNSIGESIPYGSKTELEKIGRKRNIGKYSPNTFYKAINKIFKEDEDLNIEKNLVEIAGEDWKAVLIELTKYPEELKKYLQSKQL